MSHKNNLDKLIDAVIKQGGSDLHFSEGRHPTIRVNQDLVPLLESPVLTKEDTEGLLKEMVSEEKFQEFIKNQDLDFAYENIDQTRFRGSAFIQQGRVGVVLRLVPKNIKSLNDLNLPEILIDFARRKQGLYLWSPASGF